MSKQLFDKIVLVTGATRGIGAAVAQRFASEGAHVIAVGRNKTDLEKLDDSIKSIGGTVTLVQMDLLETDKIELLAQSVVQRFGRLDILVGNAGILGELSPVPHIETSDWDKVIAINLTANFHLIRCFDTLLKKSPSPRAMFVSSGVTKSPHAYWGAYAVSKSALEEIVKTYAAENIKTTLRVNLIDPGAVRTRMRAKAFPGEDPQILPMPEDITDIFVRLTSEDLQETGQIFTII